ncbi:MAG: putative membrane protein [Sphingobacteriales bacterium]|jgi:putative membrane protein
MVDYNGKQWFFSLVKYIKLYRESYDMKRQVRIQMALLLYSVVITFILSHTEGGDFKIDPLYFSLVGIVLSLMLVFRLNTAYDRWYEGRKLWGALVNQSRFVAQFFKTNQEGVDSARMTKIRNFLSAFPWVFCLHLRGEKEDKLPNYFDAQLKSEISQKTHRPNFILATLQAEFLKSQKLNEISELDKRTLSESIREYYNILGGCERILNTPIPFSHNYFIKSFILIYTCAIPFGLYHFFGWWTLLATFIIGYALIGIEIISEAIEEPFGRDANDLPLELLCAKIEENMNEIFEHHPEEKPMDVYPYEWILH